MSEIETTRRRPEVLCTAVKKNGEPCGRPPIRGGRVCASHGGRAPQVKAKAQLRLLMNQDKLMASLLQIALDTKVPVRERLVAIRDGLDRAGLGAKQEFSVTAEISTWEQNAQAAIAVVEYVVVPDDDPDEPMSAAERAEIERDYAARIGPAARAVPAPVPEPMAVPDPSVARKTKAAKVAEVNAQIEAEISRRTDPLRSRFARRRSK